MKFKIVGIEVNTDKQTFNTKALFSIKYDTEKKIVQKNALKSWREKTSFFDNIALDKKITAKIPVNKLKKLFNFSYHTKKINIIFNRSLKQK